MKGLTTAPRTAAGLLLLLLLSVVTVQRSSAFVAPRAVAYHSRWVPAQQQRINKAGVRLLDQMGISTSEQDASLASASASSSSLVVELTDEGETEMEASALLVTTPPLSILDADDRNDSEDEDASMQPLDMGTAIFLANADENAELLEIMEEENLVSSSTSVPSASETTRTTLLDPALRDAAAEPNKNLRLEDGPMLLQDDETVQAVLAASEQAVAVAEASAVAAVVDAPSLPSTTKTEKPLQAPGVAKILKFAVPAIGVWLCSPLLSLIDTSAVGILSGTVQQAALNPAVAVTDYAALLIAFMYTGATNLIAAAREHDDGVPGAPQTSRTLIGVLQLSTFVGLGLGAVLLAAARPLLRTIIGNDSISPAVFDAALKYVRIRALGMPAAAMIGSAQAACLGMQDIKSPLYVLLAAAVVNFCGDVIFVGSSHPWIGGAAGAAWATVFSQYAAVSLFVHWMCHKARKSSGSSSRRNKEDESSATASSTTATSATPVNLSNAILELTGKPSASNRSRRKRFVDAVRSLRSGSGSSSSDDSSNNKKEPSSVAPEPQEPTFSVRGFLEGKLQRKRELLRFPPRETIDQFAPYVLPVTSTQVGRVSGYVAMSHVVSSSLGTVSMAAQQVIVSLFYCLCPIADSLSLTAQSFLPSISEKKASPARSRALRQTVLNFMKAGGVFGAIIMAFVSCIPLLSGFFTSDPMVSAMVNTVTPLLLGIFSVHGLVCASDGLLLGQKDLSFLGAMYAGFFAVVPYFMLRVKRAALADTVGIHNINLTSVWKVFLSYQLFRAAAWVGRVVVLQRRTERETPVLATAPVP